MQRENFLQATKLIWLKIYLKSNFLSFVLGSTHRSKSSESKAVAAPTAAAATASAPSSKAQIKAEAKASKEDKKKKKDPHGLKRPLSAYMLFNNSRRPLIKQEYPGKLFKNHSFTAFADRFDFLFLNFKPSLFLFFKLQMPQFAMLQKLLANSGDNLTIKLKK